MVVVVVVVVVVDDVEDVVEDVLVTVVLDFVVSVVVVWVRVDVVSGHLFSPGMQSVGPTQDLPLNSGLVTTL